MDEKRKGGVITSSGLDRLRSTIVQRLTHEVFEELKDAISWVRFANPNYLESMNLKIRVNKNVFIQPG